MRTPFTTTYFIQTGVFLKRHVPATGRPYYYLSDGEKPISRSFTNKRNALKAVPKK